MLLMLVVHNREWVWVQIIQQRLMGSGLSHVKDTHCWNNQRWFGTGSDMQTRNCGDCLLGLTASLVGLVVSEGIPIAAHVK